MIFNICLIYLIFGILYFAINLNVFMSIVEVACRGVLWGHDGDWAKEELKAQGIDRELWVNEFLDVFFGLVVIPLLVIFACCMFFTKYFRR